MPISLSHPVSRQVGQVIGSFTLDALIGRGAFGVVYRGMGPEFSLAFKFIIDERAATKEVDILLGLQGVVGVPQLIAIGEHSGFYVIIQSLAYQNLCELKSKNDGNVFTNQTIQMLSFHAVNILEQIHACGIVHQDIKLNNTMITAPQGPNHSVSLLLIDFGLGVKFRDERGEVDRSEEGNRLSLRVHSTPKVLMQGLHTCIDDVIQVTYALWGMRGIPMDAFRGELNTVYTYKNNLIHNPESSLPESLLWFHPFFKAIGEQEGATDLDYNKLKQSIKDSIVGSNPDTDIQLNDEFKLI